MWHMMTYCKRMQYLSYLSADVFKTQFQLLLFPFSTKQRHSDQTLMNVFQHFMPDKYDLVKNPNQKCEFEPWNIIKWVGCWELHVSTSRAFKWLGSLTLTESSFKYSLSVTVLSQSHSPRTPLPVICSFFSLLPVMKTAPPPPHPSCIHQCEPFELLVAICFSPLSSLYLKWPRWYWQEETQPRWPFFESLNQLCSWCLHYLYRYHAATYRQLLTSIYPTYLLNIYLPKYALEEWLSSAHMVWIHIAPLPSCCPPCPTGTIRYVKTQTTRQWFDLFSYFM